MDLSESTKMVADFAAIVVWIDVASLDFLGWVENR
jgi:hypothetical protein